MHIFTHFTRITCWGEFAWVGAINREGKFYGEWAIFRGAIFLGGNCPDTSFDVVCWTSGQLWQNNTNIEETYEKNIGKALTKERSLQLNSCELFLFRISILHLISSAKLKLDMEVYLRAKFEVSSIILTRFRQVGVILPSPPLPPTPVTSKRTPKKPTQIRVKAK